MLIFVGAFWVQVSQIMIELAIPSYLTISGDVGVFLAIGSLWIYTTMITEPLQGSADTACDLTIKRGWRYYWLHYRHLWPLPVALVLLLKTVSLPEADFVALLQSGKADTNAKMAAVTPYLIVQVLLTLWTMPYLVSITRKLSRYRKKLRDIHSSTENLEMLWISALVGVIFLDWCRSVLQVIDMFGPELNLPWFINWPLDGLVILIPALWGLRQMPAMREALQPGEAVVEAENTADRIARYERSALEETDLKRIAEKIELVMDTEHLYREPGFSLGSLSRHIGVSPNYISQTLNVQLKESFYSYVNRRRVLDAESRMRNELATYSDTIMQIAYDSGFNSRSSFYKAFNREFGCAPAAYRKRFLKLVDDSAK